MSQHDIEDLVEDSIRCVLASDRDNADKRRLAARLYRFQHLFDTSDTYGRLREPLEAIGYVEAQDDVELPLLNAVASVVREADGRSDRHLIHDWVALLARALDGGEARDEVPNTLQEIVADASALAIRAAAVRHAVGEMRWSNGMRIERRSWRQYSSGYATPQASTLETKHAVRFFSDFKASLGEIVAGHTADQQKIEALAQAPLNRLPQLIEQRGAFIHLGSERLGFSQRPSFSFQIGKGAADADGSCYYLLIEHVPDLGNVLVPSIGVQSGTLCRWQGREPGWRDEDMHFKLGLDQLVPQARKELDRDLIKGGIGWPYKIEQSEAVLIRKLEALLGFVPEMLLAVQAFYRKPLGKQLDATTPAKLLARRRTLASSKGFFVNRVEIMFAFACRAWERGEGPSESMLDHMAALVDATHETHPLKGHWEAALTRLRTGIAFPPLGQVRMSAKLQKPVPDWAD